MSISTHTTFRPEIQGLRAIAVVSVLIYHVWPSALPGGFVGVDIFFVISGFLITEVLLRDVHSTGSIDLLRFYGRRIKRLLPAATVVLLATAIGYPLLPQVAWSDHASQMLASAFYYQNWWLGLQAVDYLGAERAPGVLQHFWSLSVEEQYYLIWPLFFLAVRMAFTRSRYPAVSILGASIAMVFVVSLIHSIVYSHSQPEMAYFASSTRAWELALGGLLAVYGGNWKPQGALRLVGSGCGLLLMLVAFALIDAQSIFPGYVALLPTVGAAVVIFAGDHSARWSVQAVLRSRAFQYLGDISYSLYLWHWPVIIYYQYLANRPLSPVDGIVVIVVSGALAHQTKALIEDPFRQADYGGLGRRWPLVLALVCLAASALGAWYVQQAYQRALQSPGAETPANVALAPAASSAYTPSALQAREDRPLVAQMGCHTPQAERQPRSCSFGEADSPVQMVLVGDSHAVQWAPAFRELALANDWHLTVLTKSACAFAAVPVRVGRPPRRFEECLAWTANVEQLLQTLQPTHIVVGQSMAHRVHGVESATDSARLLAEAYATLWQHLSRNGAEVLVLRDTPRMGLDVPECLSTPGKGIADCSVRRADALDRKDRPDPLLLAAEMAEQVHLLDFSEQICGDLVCPAVRDGVLLWRDGHHLSATFVRRLKPVIAARLQAVLQTQISAGEQASLTVPDSRQGPASMFTADQLANANLDRPAIYADGCLYNGANAAISICEYGDAQAPTHVVLAGDTRAGQWLPALQALAARQPLRISTVLTYGCALGSVPYQRRDCSAWTNQLTAAVTQLAADVVIYSQSRGYRVPGTQRGQPNAQALADEFVRVAGPLVQQGQRLVVVPDSPRMAVDVNACLGKLTTQDADRCAVARAAALPNAQRPDPMLLAATMLPGLQVVNLNDVICPPPGQVCPAVAGQMLMWRSKYLLTASYAASLSQPFQMILQSP